MKDGVRAHPDFCELLLRNGLEAYEDFTGRRSACAGSPAGDGGSIVLTLDGSDGPRDLVLHRGARLGLRQVLDDLCRLRLPTAPIVRQARVAEVCRECGIEAVAVAAYGCRRRLGLGWQGFLLTERVTLGTPVPQILREWQAGTPPTARQSHRFCYELGRFVGGLHHSHVAFGRPNLGRIYARPQRFASGNDLWHFRLADFEGMVLTSSRRQHRSDLRRLLRAGAALCPARRDLLRFALGYATARRDPRVPVRKALAHSFAWAKPMLRRLSARPAMAKLDNFIRIGRVVVHAAYMPLLQENGIGSFRNVFQYAGGVRLDKPGLGRRERIRVQLSGSDGQPVTLYLKRYHRPGLRDQWRRMLTCRADHSAAWWEWQQVRRLRRAGIPTPIPVAFGEKMGGWREKCSFIVLASAPGESLERWVPRHLMDGQTTIGVEHRRTLVRQVALLARALHQAGFCHRDLYLSHVFVDMAEPSDPVLTLIDLQRVFQPRWRKRRWRVKDLASLHFSCPRQAVSATDRLRFALAYLDADRLSPASKQLIRQVAAKAARIARRSERKAAVAARQPNANG